MPPVEAWKVLWALLVSKRCDKAGNKLKMAIYDISRAHFYAVSLRKVYCNLPAGEEQEGKCARLVKANVRNIGRSLNMAGNVFSGAE